MHKTRHSFRLVSLLSVSIGLTGCGMGAQQQGTSQPDYKTTKTMVVDILETEEAKKAVAKMMKDEDFQKDVVLNEETMRKSLIQSIAKPDNPQIKEAFKDPKFTSTLAKAMQDEQKQLMKDLMKDPEYQKMMISITKDPEFEKNMLELMKSSQYRKQTMQVMRESLESPMFQVELLKLMEKATEEAMKPKEKKKGGKNEEGGEGEEGGSGAGGGG